MELFKAVHLWATKRCEERGLSPDGSEKRRILGERIVKGIRFPVMTQHEFAEVVVDCKILTPDEALSVFKYFSSVPDTPVGFSEKKRIGSRGSFQRCCRFGSVVNTESGYTYKPDKMDCLLFEVDKDISLLGVTLCGSKNNMYSVTMKVIDFVDNKYLYSKTGNFFPEFIKYESVSYCGFNIFFDQPVLLKRGVDYRVEASISGPNSCFGQNGKDYVLCAGVKFNFKRSSYSTNGTDVVQGQFPELLFIVK